MCHSQVTTTTMRTGQPESELSLSQLLDALERRLDMIAGALRYCGALPSVNQLRSHPESPTVAGRTPRCSNRFERCQKYKGQSFDLCLTQVDDAISRISDIWRKAKNIKNSLAPINKLPPETLALIAAFLKPGSQLIDATAVCQHWRATLLSFPRLWNTIRCSNLMQFEAYLERSKSVPLNVRFHDLDPHLFGSLISHTSRLAILRVQVECSSDLSQIVQYLRNPLPMLYKFIITSSPFASDALELSSGVGDGYFMHVKELQLKDISSFRAPLTFPHVTKLAWYVGPCPRGSTQLPGLLDTLEQFPVLKVVYLVFQTRQHTTTDPSPHMVTLPHVQRMSLVCSEGWGARIPPILGFLKLPNLTSLSVDTVPELPSPFPVLPITSFGEHLPNLAELPEMEVYMKVETGRVRFRSPSQAVLDYRTVTHPLEDLAYHHHRVRWGGLPLHSVRRLTVTLYRRGKGAEGVWLVRLVRDLGSLEHLELVGYCGCVLRRLRRLMMRGGILLGVKTLTVRSGAYDRRQAMRLKDTADGLGLETTVSYIRTLGVTDTDGWSPDADGLSEGWDLSDEGESDKE
jgi:hypothetical protein